MFHDGDGRTRSSSWSNPSHLVERQRDSISLLFAIAERSEGTIEARRVKTCKGLVHESAVIAQTCQPIGHYVTFIVTQRHILTHGNQTGHQWGERGRGGLAMVSMDRKDATDEPCE